MVPSACAAMYGCTTCSLKSSLKLNTKWSIPICCATRRASSTSETEQQPVSLSPPHKRMVTPTTSWPSCFKRAAATEESTPPDIAMSTFMERSLGALMLAQAGYCPAQCAKRTGNIARRGGVAQAETQSPLGTLARHAHGGQNM